MPTELELNKEQLNDMPSDTSTDVDLIPCDQTPKADTDGIFVEGGPEEEA